MFVFFVSICLFSSFSILFNHFFRLALEGREAPRLEIWADVFAPGGPGGDKTSETSSHFITFHLKSFLFIWKSIENLKILSSFRRFHHFSASRPSGRGRARPQGSTPRSAAWKRCKTLIRSSRGAKRVEKRDVQRISNEFSMNFHLFLKALQGFFSVLSLSPFFRARLRQDHHVELRKLQVAAAQASFNDNLISFDI